MTTVTVFRRVPPPIIGVCGVVRDRGFGSFEQDLDWLEATGVLVERIDPQERPEEIERFKAARESLAREEDRVLPIIFVDGVLASSGRRPTRSQLARLVGRSRRQPELPVAV